MKFNQTTASIFIPDGKPIEEALQRTTHLGIGAHPDDLEFMALHGILECFQNDQQWFTGVIVTDGSGSSRSSAYARFSDEEMKRVRRKEQHKAAVIGEYSAMICLDYPSASIKKPERHDVIGDLKKIFSVCKPSQIYTHNLADKHDTHIAVVLSVIQALRELPDVENPKSIFGCEVWRSLDWMLDSDKILLDASSHENISASLTGVFDSQICGGKRYDLATLGRKRCNATYLSSHQRDESRFLEYAMDLTPLVRNPSLDVQEYVARLIQRFSEDTTARISKFSK